LLIASQDGKWVQDESFVYCGKPVHRKAGTSAGNTMMKWRQAREQHPELFDGLKVWQSPTAFVDSIVWSWQQREESSRHSQIVRLVDSLRTHWTDQSQHRNFLSQAIQLCVPPGCTPLAQPTDTGFAQPAKAAARTEHDRQRALLERKARAEGANCVHKVGAQELLQTAGAMHKRMVELNQSAETVLAEARACGWMHWRPDLKAGKLVKALDT